MVEMEAALMAPDWEVFPLSEPDISPLGPQPGVPDSITQFINHHQIILSYNHKNTECKDTVTMSDTLIRQTRQRERRVYPCYVIPRVGAEGHNG